MTGYVVTNKNGQLEGFAESKVSDKRKKELASMGRFYFELSDSNRWKIQNLMERGFDVEDLFNVEELQF